MREMEEFAMRPAVSVIVPVYNVEPCMGLGATRKDGMQAAQGDYVISCDSDDGCNTDAYEKLYAKAIEEDADLVCCGYYEEYANEKIARRPPSYLSLPVSLLHIFSPAGGIVGYLCNKLVKRKFYVDGNIYPYEGVNMWEDVGLSVRLCYLSTKTTGTAIVSVIKL
jgi:glycosyltransferase involved in cell wall biosynthesis